MEEKEGFEVEMTWEEEIYWKHFNAMLFYQILPKNFYDHLVLPAKFAKHMKGKLPNQVSLIGPSGSVWEVELLKKDDIRFGGDGWRGFAKAHDLAEKYILIFKYKQNMSFEVLVFDGESSCEKEATYFVEKYPHKKLEHKTDKTRTPSETPTEAIEIVDDDDDNGSKFVIPKKSRKVVADEHLVHERPRNYHVSSGTFIFDASAQDDCNVSYLPSSNKYKEKFVPEERHSGQWIGPKRSVQCFADDGTGHRTKKASVAKTGGKPRRARVAGRSSKKYKSRTDNIIWKARQFSGSEQITLGVGEREVITLNNGETTQETCASHKSGRKRGRPAKHFIPESAKALSLKSDLEQQIAKVDPEREVITLNNGINALDKTACPVSGRKRGRPPKSGKSLKNMEVITLNNGINALDQTACPVPGWKRGRPPKIAKKAVYLQYISQRRPVTDAEKENALARAVKGLTDRSFILVMQPTCVYKKFYVHIPADWRDKHLSCAQREVVLRIGEKTWPAKLYWYPNKGAGLNAGWKKFAVENHLEEFDVCLFKLASSEGCAEVILDVEIFRVVEEIVPPSQVLVNTT